MSENELEKKPNLKYEHIALSETSSLKINNWLDQVALKKKGVKITRKQFVNWLIEKMPDNLSGGDLASLIDRFYGEVKFLRHLLREANQAKADGKSETGYEFVVKTKRQEVKREPAEDQSEGDSDPVSDSTIR